MKIFIYTTLLLTNMLGNTLDFDSTYTPGSQYCNPLFQNIQSSSRKCHEQSFYHTQDLGSLLKGSTSVNYALEKDMTNERVSMVANYSRNGFIAQLQNSQEKDTTTDEGYSSDTTINLIYQDKLLENFTTTVSQSFFLPTQATNIETNPASYTSTLETQYFIDSTYDIFTQSNYTYLKKSSSALLSNPYNFETGVSYKNNKRSSLTASYSQAKDKSKFAKTSKISTLSFKHKINKKIKTSLTINKSLAACPQEDSASVKINYAF
ncbi:hypothetical protein [Sulfurimonas sp.]|uniref:hypothetical protein n=1 Tax=Sulfurimonas sp. TaxID=2022749 RepID=UPI0025D2786E|nr:hypothetical protein [Sulfurimonas sp.]